MTSKDDIDDPKAHWAFETKHDILADLEQDFAAVQVVGAPHVRAVPFSSSAAADLEAAAAF